MPKKEKAKSPKTPISPKQNEQMDTPFGVSRLPCPYLGFIYQPNIIEYTISPRFPFLYNRSQFHCSWYRTLILMWRLMMLRCSWQWKRNSLRCAAGTRTRSWITSRYQRNRAANQASRVRTVHTYCNSIYFAVCMWII